MVGGIKALFTLDHEPREIGVWGEPIETVEGRGAGEALRRHKPPRCSVGVSEALHINELTED